MEEDLRLGYENSLLGIFFFFFFPFDYKLLAKDWIFRCSSLYFSNKFQFKKKKIY